MQCDHSVKSVEKAVKDKVYVVISDAVLLLLVSFVITEAALGLALLTLLLPLGLLEQATW